MKDVLIGKGGDDRDGKGSGDPSTRHRLLPLKSRLEQQGHKVWLLSSDLGFFGKIGLIALAQWADVVIIQRKLFSVPFVHLLVSVNQHLVFDFDDAIFLRSNGEASPRRYRKFKALLQRVDVVWAGNRYLAEAAREIARSVSIVPTPVADDAYDRTVAQSGKFTLVWLGSRSTSRYLHEHAEHLRAMGEAYPDIVFRIVSDFEADFAPLVTECVPWSEETEVTALKSAHVGIAPMTDNAWARGKCAFKVIQYMAAGLPVISSPVGANVTVMLPGETGFLADTPEAWVKVVGRLRNDDALRQRLGAAGLKRFSALFSESRVRAQLLASLEDHKLLT